MKYYEQVPLPILLVRYDAVERIGYWVNTQKYIEKLDSINPNWREQEYIRLKIPLENQLSDLNMINGLFLEPKSESRIVIPGIFESTSSFLGANQVL